MTREPTCAELAERTYWSRVQRRLDSGVTVRYVHRSWRIYRNGEYLDLAVTAPYATLLYLRACEEIAP